MQEDEVEAITALRTGDLSGLRVLVERYQLPALRLAYNLCNSREVAEDAVADAFLAVAKHVGSYDTARPFHAWFYRIVVNSVRAQTRHERRLRTAAEAHQRLRPQPDPVPGPESSVLKQEHHEALLHQIDKLPLKQREAIVLRYYLDLDERTMSGILDVPLGTVKWRLFQGRKTLRRQLREDAEAHFNLLEEGHRS